MSSALKRISVQEYLERERQSSIKSEFFDGQVFAMAGGSARHSLIAANFVREAGNALKDRPCALFNSDLRILVLTTGLRTYPDATIVCGEQQFEDERQDTLTNPTVIIEVLSDSSEKYDHGRLTHLPRFNQLAAAPLKMQSPFLDQKLSCPWLTFWMLVFVPLLAACQSEGEYPSRPITIVCPWAAGGGTDRVSRQLAMALEQRLGQPVNVINATGGKGVSGHNRGLRARPDGYTLTMMTFELNTMHWTGLTDLTYADSIPLVSVNEDYAALLVRGDSSWQTLQDVERAIADSSKQLTASGTAIGGAWHLALAGWLVAAGLKADAVNWIPAEGANPSLQQLMSGGVDLVCCSLPEARTLLESDEVRALGVMSDKPALGFEDVPTFAAQGRNWTLGGWRGLAVPRNTPQAIVERLSQELEAIVSQPPISGSFAEFMLLQKFDNTWRGPQEFAEFIKEGDTKLGELLQQEAMRSISQDKFNPMTAPYILMGLMGVTLVGIALSGRRTEQVTSAEMIPMNDATSSSGKWNFAWIILSIVAFILLAETVGFLLLMSLVLTLLMMRLGNQWLPSLFVSSLFVLLVYFVFAYGLRVPLPRGWLG